MNDPHPYIRVVPNLPETTIPSHETPEEALPNAEGEDPFRARWSPAPRSVEDAAFQLIEDAIDAEELAERSNAFDEWRQCVAELPPIARSKSPAASQIVGMLIANLDPSRDVDGYSADQLAAFRFATGLLRAPCPPNFHAETTADRLKKAGLEIALPFGEPGEQEAHRLSERLEQLLAGSE